MYKPVHMNYLKYNVLLSCLFISCNNIAPVEREYNCYCIDAACASQFAISSPDLNQAKIECRLIATHCKIEGE